MKLASRSLQGKKILLVNTGYHKKEFILKKLKSLGLYIICLNKNINWAEPYIDEWILADTYNHEASLLAVKNYISTDLSKPDGVLTFWEDDVLLTSKIVRDYQFTGIQYEHAINARNKFLFRQFCKEHHLPPTNFQNIAGKKDLEIVRKRLKFPIVLKPAFGSLTTMIIKVDTPHDLEDTYQFIRKNLSTKSESALHDGLSIFAEEYIDGDEVDIDMILQNGKVKVAIVSDNFNKSRGRFFLDKGQQTPSILPAETQQELTDMAELVLERLGILNGCIHFEAKYSALLGPVPLEANLRMGGDYVYHYISTAWGIDLIELASCIALNQYIPKQYLQKPNTHVIGWDFSVQASGILHELTIKPELKKAHYYEGCSVYKEIGDAVLVPPEGFETLGWMTISGENQRDVEDNLELARAFVHFKVSKYNYRSSLGKSEKLDDLTTAAINKRYLLSREKINYISQTAMKKLDIGIMTNPKDTAVKETTANMTAYAAELAAYGFESVRLIRANDPEYLYRELNSYDYDLIINGLEYTPEHTTTNLKLLKTLEIAGIPYSGPDSFTVNLIHDRLKLFKLLTFHEIPLPSWDYLYDTEDSIDEDLQYPLVVKLAQSTDTVSLDPHSYTQERLLSAFAQTHFSRSNVPLLIQERLDGTEFLACIVGNEESELRALPLQTTKQDSSTLHNAKIETLMHELAIDVFNILDATDYLTITFKLDREHNPHLLGIDNSLHRLITAQPAKDTVTLLTRIIEVTISRYQHA